MAIGSCFRLWAYEAVPTFLGHIDPKSFQEAALSRPGDDHGAAVLHPLGPTEIEAALGERRSYRARDMWPSFVQSRHNRQKRRRVELNADRSIPNSVRKRCLPV